MVDDQSANAVESQGIIVPAIGLVALGTVLWRRWWRVPRRDENGLPASASQRAMREGEVVVALILSALVVWLAQALGAVSAKSLVGLSSSDLRMLRGMSLAATGGYLGSLVAVAVVCLALPWVPRIVGLGANARSLKIGVIGVLLVIPITMLTASVTTFIVRLTSDSDVPHVVHDTLQLLRGGPGHASNNGAIPDNGAIWWWVMVGAVVIGAPIIEETIYRGFIQTALRRAVGSGWIAILITSTLFTLAHVQVVSGAKGEGLIGLPLLFVLSLGFGVAYERSGKIASSIVIHAVFNALNVLIASML